MRFVVFLDVDGVLNTKTTCARAPSEVYRGVDDERIKILSKTMKECGTEGVVLTSTWKDLKSDDEDYLYLTNALSKHGIKILGKTQESSIGSRGEGIMKYLVNHNDIEEFVILDDQHFDFDDDPKLWENYLNTQGKGIEHSVAASKTPTITAMDFCEVIKKHSR